MINTFDEDDINALRDIYKANDFIAEPNLINKRKEDIIDGKILIYKTFEFYDKIILNNAKVQNDTYNYFLKNKNFNIATLYEHDLVKGDSYRGDFLIPYVRFLNKDKHYPHNESNFLSIIDSQKIDNTQRFWNLITLSSLCKNDTISAKCFINTIEKTKWKLALLDLEKVKKIWDKRFNSIDINNISPEESNKLNVILNKIDHNKNKNFFTIQEGYFVKIKLDSDILSQSNKLTINKNNEAIINFFSKFEKFIKNNKDEDLLSLTDFSLNRSSLTLDFSFSNEKNKTIINSLAADLIDYATKKIDKNNLQGAISIGNDENLFFIPLLRNYLLKSTLSNKNEEFSLKKIKI